ncbi:MAG: GAF domain-containing protein, partial [Chloroflexota bacterium]|nr:GAF domain-containing protein [Chloroflexota bacterium]
FQVPDVLEKTVVIMEAEGGAIYLLDEIGSKLAVAARRGELGEAPDNLQILDPHTEVFSQIIASGNPVVINGLLFGTAIEELTGENLEDKAYAVAPLRSKGKTLGVIILYGTNLDDIKPETLRLLTAMSDEIGIGIDNALSTRKLREASAEIHQLLNKAIASGFEVWFENPYLVKCWEEKNCEKVDCPAYKSENLRCWQVAGIFATDENPERFTHVGCPVYQKNCQRDEITAIGEDFNNMMFLLAKKEGQLVRNNVGLSTLVQCAQILSSTDNLHNKLQRVMNALSVILPGAAGILFLYHRDELRFSVEASFGCDAEPLSQVSLQPEEWIAGAATRVDEAAAICAVHEVEDLEESISIINRDNLEKARSGLTHSSNIVCAPLFLGEVLMGILSLFDVADLQAMDVSLTQTLADQIAVTIEKDRLYQELRHRERGRGELLRKLITAQEEERKRVARELHDEAGQAITALMMSTSMAAASLPEDMKEEQEKFLETNRMAHDVLSQIRKVILELRPAVLDDLGLVPAIRWYAKQNLGGANIDINLELDTLKQRLPTEIEVTVFRVAQEAFTNIVRHSKASKVEVKLSIVDSTLELIIQDNGKGFVPGSVLEEPGLDGGWGLRGMQERIVLLSGSLDIESKLGKGTTIVAQIPLGDDIHD